MQKKSPQTSSRVFLGSFWRAFVPVAGVLFLVALVVLVRVKPANMSLWEFMLYLFIADLFAAGPVAFGCWYYKVDVDADGIGGYTLMNEYVRLTWTDITEVRAVCLLPGLQYLRLIARRGMPVIWLPLGMKDLQGFHAAVSEYTSTDHPLRQKMQAYMPLPTADQLPAEDVLVRSSSEPTTPENVLLRAATPGEGTESEKELLRASVTGGKEAL